MIPATPEADEVQEFYHYLTVNARGRGNAKTAREITDGLKLGDDGRRRCRALAHSASDHGLLVCSCNDGYFIPRAEDEVGETVGRLRSEANEMFDRARTIETLARRIFGEATQPHLIKTDGDSDD